MPVVHATDLGARLPDGRLWDYARANALAVVTKDADFSDRIMIAQAPPWIVHLRIGNVRLRAFHDLLARAWPRVEGLLPINKLVCVYPDRIEAVRD